MHNHNMIPVQQDTNDWHGAVAHRRTLVATEPWRADLHVKNGCHWCTQVFRTVTETLANGEEFGAESFTVNAAEFVQAFPMLDAHVKVSE